MHHSPASSFHVQLFDTDGNGVVEYHEFLKTMFKAQS